MSTEKAEPAGSRAAGAEALLAESQSLLDSYKHYRNTPASDPQARPATPKKWHCGQWTMVGTGTHAVAHSRLHCKSYRCGRCGPRKRRRLGHRLAELAREHKLYRMATLTLDPKLIPAGKDSITYIRGVVWRKMRVYLARRFRRRVVYIAVLELHQNGIAHLHVLLDAFIPHSWLVGSWSALGGGRICRLQCVDVRNVAAYLSKYLSKEQELPASVRRVTTSRGLTLWPEAHGKVRPDDVSWTLVRAPINCFRQRAANPREEHFETEADGAIVLVWFVADLVPLAFGRTDSSATESR